MIKGISLIILTLAALAGHAQNITISGFVWEADSEEKLMGVNIADLNSQRGTSSNKDGYYSLSLPAGTGGVIFSYVGYQRDTLNWYSTSDLKLDFRLVPSVNLEPVKIQSGRIGRIEDESQASHHMIPIENIDKLPALFGETDIVKSLQLMPGIQSGNEASAGIFVRGGSIDQNLILIDGVHIYNPTHVLGIFSSINSDAIKSVNITKGGFPARFGGRLSSVVEINMKEGHSNDFHGSGQIGLISSKLLLEGPIVPGKGAFLISGRRSYTDLVARPVVKLTYSATDSEIAPMAFFQDVNMKAYHRFNEKNKLTFSGYYGADRYGVNHRDEREQTNALVTWNNYLGSLNWNHRVAPKLFTHTTLTYSRYSLNNDIKYSFFKNEIHDYFNSIYYSGISDIGLKYSMDFMLTHQHSMKMGMEWTHHTYSPGALTYRYELEGENVSQVFSQEGMKSQERTFYLEDDMEFGRWKMNAGFHFSQFYTGKKLYYSFQPRFSMRYLFPGKWAFKASYAQMEQYINLLASESLSLPTDLWVPSTDRIQPQTSWQAVAGIAKSMWKDYEFSLEGYYKEMNNVLSYQPGVSFILDVASSTDWQNKIAQGRGWSYGTEVLFQKKFGRTTGWLAYTLSWNYRQFDGINQGEKFPFKYDRRHDFNVVLSHDLSENWSFSGVWIYGTGNAYSLPDTYYKLPPGYFGETGGAYSVYSAKNNYRLSDYHRLDISIKRKNRKRWGETYWTFGAYNTYYRKNALYVMQDRGGQVREVAVLPAIPYISWGFKF